MHRSDCADAQADRELSFSAYARKALTNGGAHLFSFLGYRIIGIVHKPLLTMI